MKSTCMFAWVLHQSSLCACVFAQHRRIMYVGRFSQASAPWDFDNPCWITFISHILWHLTLNETLHSLLLHSSALIPLFPSLCLPPYIAALLRKQGVGRQSHSPFQGSKSLFFLCFPRSCSVLHVAALLSCSTLSPTVSLPPSPHSRCLSGHRTSFWFLPANKLASTLCAHLLPHMNHTLQLAEMIRFIHY